MQRPTGGNGQIRLSILVRVLQLAEDEGAIRLNPIRPE
jgi:hypothetical protein